MLIMCVLFEIKGIVYYELLPLFMMISFFENDREIRENYYAKDKCINERV